jgi:hypothetical protein
MKKIVAIILLFSLLGCAKEPESGEIVTFGSSKEISAQPTDLPNLEYLDSSKLAVQRLKDVGDKALKQTPKDGRKKNYEPQSLCAGCPSLKEIKEVSEPTIAYSE